MQCLMNNSEFVTILLFMKKETPIIRMMKSFVSDYSNFKAKGYKIQEVMNNFASEFRPYLIGDPYFFLSKLLCLISNEAKEDEFNPSSIFSSFLVNRCKIL